MTKPVRILDISMAVRPTMAHWPTSAPPEHTWDARLADGGTVDQSYWRLDAHTGTHVDAPSHHVLGGSTTSDLDLGPLVGPARVVQVGDDVAVVSRPVVESLDLAGVRRVLLRTSNTDRRIHLDEFQPDCVALSPDGADALAAAGIRAVGVDYLSVEQFSAPSAAAHRALFAAGIAVIEGCDLRGVAAGDYVLCCLPLRLIDGEAAPARTILIDGLPWPAETS